LPQAIVSSAAHPDSVRSSENQAPITRDRCHQCAEGTDEEDNVRGIGAYCIHDRVADGGAPATGFLDAYVERCAKPAGLKSLRALGSRIVVLKKYRGELPLDSLEEPDDINRFKTESDYAEEVEVATMNRALETLRAAMNWGLAQTPPLFRKSPFHRYGVRMNKKAETMRDRR
jgi:hypothetical protein